MKEQTVKRKSCFSTKRGDVVFYLSNDLLIENIIYGNLELQPIADVFLYLCNCDKVVCNYLCMVFSTITRHLSPTADLNTQAISHCTGYLGSLTQQIKFIWKLPSVHRRIILNQFLSRFERSVLKNGGAWLIWALCYLWKTV